MSTSTLSGWGRTLEIGLDMRMASRRCMRVARFEVPERWSSRAPGPASVDLVVYRSRRPRSTSFAFCNRYELPVFGADVVCRWADDLAVAALLDDMRRPSGRARDHEQRREHLRRHAHHVVAHRRIPIQVGEHALGIPHDLLDALGDLEHLHLARFLRQFARDRLDRAVARIGDGVHRMAEPDDDFLRLDPAANVAVRFGGP